MRDFETYVKAGASSLRCHLCSSSSAQTTPRPTTLTTMGWNAADFTEGEIRLRYNMQIEKGGRTVCIRILKDVLHGQVVGYDDLLNAQLLLEKNGERRTMSFWKRAALILYTGPSRSVHREYSTSTSPFATRYSWPKKKSASSTGCKGMPYSIKINGRRSIDLQQWEVWQWSKNATRQ